MSIRFSRKPKYFITKFQLFGLQISIVFYSQFSCFFLCSVSIVFLIVWMKIVDIAFDTFSLPYLTIKLKLTEKFTFDHFCWIEFHQSLTILFLSSILLFLDQFLSRLWCTFMFKCWPRKPCAMHSFRHFCSDSWHLNSNDWTDFQHIFRFIRCLLLSLFLFHSSCVCLSAQIVWLSFGNSHRMLDSFCKYSCSKLSTSTESLKMNSIFDVSQSELNRWNAMAASKARRWSTMSSSSIRQSIFIMKSPNIR